MNGIRQERNTHTLDPKEATKQRAIWLGQALEDKLPPQKIKNTTLEDLAREIERDYNNRGQNLERLHFFLKPLREFFGDCKAKSITSTRVSDYISHRKQQGLSDKTINRELAALGRCFNLGKTMEIVDKAPYIKCLKEEPYPERWLTYEEEEILLQAAPEWLKNVIIFAIETGWDQREIINVGWPSIDLEKKVAYGFREKTEVRRSTPLSNRVFELLRSLKQRTGVIFLNNVGEKINQNTLKWAFHELCKKTGIENCRFKDLRHTFATRLAQNGADPYTVQKLMGHKSFSTTARYAHHFIESLRRGIRIMEDARPTPKALPEPNSENLLKNDDLNIETKIKDDVIV